MRRSKERLLHQVWDDLRFYLGIAIVDFAILAILWCFLFAFKLLTKVLAIEGWAGKWIVAAHSISTLLAFVTFGILFVLHVWSRRK